VNYKYIFYDVARDIYISSKVVVYNEMRCYSPPRDFVSRLYYSDYSSNSLCLQKISNNH